MRNCAITRPFAPSQHRTLRVDRQLCELCEPLLLGMARAPASQFNNAEGTTRWRDSGIEKRRRRSSSAALQAPASLVAPQQYQQTSCVPLGSLPPSSSRGVSEIGGLSRRRGVGAKRPVVQDAHHRSPRWQQSRFAFWLSFSCWPKVWGEGLFSYYSPFSGRQRERGKTAHERNDKSGIFVMKIVQQQRRGIARGTSLPTTRFALWR